MLIKKSPDQIAVASQVSAIIKIQILQVAISLYELNQRVSGWFHQVINFH